MYRSETAHRLSVLLRISRELDIVGDVTATVDSPAELLAWVDTLPDPVARAWCSPAGNRYVQVSSPSQHDPVHGRVTAVLAADTHEQFWQQLVPASDLAHGEQVRLTLEQLASAWEAMPLSIDEPEPSSP